MNFIFISKNLSNGGDVNVKQKNKKSISLQRTQLHEQEFIERGDVNVKQKMNSPFLYNELQFPEQEFIERGGGVC